MQTLTILVAHGSSDTHWSDTFVGLTEPTRSNHPDTRLAFMELSHPSIEQVVAEGYDNGFNDFKVLPLFLAKGKHLKKDIPTILKKLEEQYGITTTLLPPIGEHPELSLAINRIIDQTIQNKGTSD